MVRAPADCGLTGMKPHYYHVVRWNKSTAPTFITIQGDNGEFVEPTSRVFEMLREGDLWDPQVMRKVRQARSNADAAAAKYRASGERCAAGGDPGACRCGDADAGEHEP
jgi:hypothetical protein